MPFENIMAGLMQESSGGTDATNAGRDSGMYGWLTGSTQGATIPSAQNDGRQGIYEAWGITPNNSTPMNSINTFAKLMQAMQPAYGGYPEAYGAYSAGEYSSSAAQKDRADRYRRRLQ
jgi:hypothetical protein